MGFTHPIEIGEYDIAYVVEYSTNIYIEPLIQYLIEAYVFMEALTQE